MKEKKIVIIDGQGGKIGRLLIEQWKASAFPQPYEIYAIGTNSTATAAMLKAGADYGATGENPVVVACRDAAVVVGPLGIIAADSLLGEVTPAMAVAVGQCPAPKILLPINRCNHFVIGLQPLAIGEQISLAVQRMGEVLRTDEKA